MSQEQINQASVTDGQQTKPNFDTEIDSVINHECLKDSTGNNEVHVVNGNSDSECDKVVSNDETIRQDDSSSCMAVSKTIADDIAKSNTHKDTQTTEETKYDKTKDSLSQCHSKTGEEIFVTSNNSTLNNLEIMDSEMEISPGAVVDKNVNDNTTDTNKLCKDMNVKGYTKVLEHEKDCVSENIDDIVSVSAFNENIDRHNLIVFSDTNGNQYIKDSTEMYVIPDALNTQGITEKESVRSETNIDSNLQETIEIDDDENAAIEVPPLKYGKRNVELFTEDSGPQIYDVKGNITTPPIKANNLPQVFQDLPIFGRPNSKSELNDFYNTKIREFVGCDLDDDEFNDLANYCSPENLKIGNELVMLSNIPSNNLLSKCNLDMSTHQTGSDLCTVKKHKLRVDKDVKGLFITKLKYRSIRVIPLPQEDNLESTATPSCPMAEDDLLEPGKDILFKVRVYRPYCYAANKERAMRTRHSLLCSDIILSGRHSLAALRDRFVCHNDLDMRVDVSNNLDMLPKTKAKDIFPSGFLFINNVFYVDTREGCIDYSQPIREWAATRGIGEFQKRDMCQTRLSDIVVKLGYPDMYMHQGNCEHVFVFSEIRLLNASDPLRFSLYPCSTGVGQNHIMYCMTCAEYSTRWIVTGCSRVPFDPAYFCDTCFRQYLYKDGQKIGEFKAYTYGGNSLNMLKPQW